MTLNPDTYLVPEALGRKIEFLLLSCAFFLKVSMLMI